MLTRAIDTAHLVLTQLSRSRAPDAPWALHERHYALVMHLDQLSTAEVGDTEPAHRDPTSLRPGRCLATVSPGGTYLDTAAAAAGIAEVAAQGGA